MGAGDAKYGTIRNEELLPAQEVPLAEEEGSGIFDDTEDLW